MGLSIGCLALRSVDICCGFDRPAFWSATGRISHAPAPVVTQLSRLPPDWTKVTAISQMRRCRSRANRQFSNENPKWMVSRQHYTPAADDECLTGDESRFIRQKKPCEIGNVFWGTDASQRCSRNKAVEL